MNNIIGNRGRGSARSVSLVKGKGFFLVAPKKGQKAPKEPPKALPPIAGSIEAHAITLGLIGKDRWKGRAARAIRRWPAGAIVSLDEFKEAVKAATSMKISAR
jgi:hypothetical protein